MKKATLFLFCLLISGICFSQVWKDRVIQESINPTFFDFLNSFNNYQKTHPYTKGNGFKPYARIIDFLEPRMPSHGVFPANALWKEWLKQRSKVADNNSNWIALGPFDVPIIQSNGKKRGNGRVNCIEFDPINPDILWVGSPGGGLWKSIDDGNSWTTNTDNLPVLGVSDIAIDPTNRQIMYIATGDADGDDTYSIGVLKSLDGGNSWNTTGLSYTVNQGYNISKLEINPNYTDSIFAVTDDNILVSADGAQTWVSVGPNGRWRDIHYKPEDTKTLYAVKQTSGTSSVYRSVDGGSTWQISNNGVLNTNKRRPLIAVTPANKEVVYALFSDGSYGYHGLYKSTNGGDSWTLQSDTPNILGRETDGSDLGGQSWYNLTLAVSTIDENHIYVGGINLWESTDGGVTWNIEASSGNSSNYSYMHVDHHAAEFNPLNNIAYVGNDGGIYKHFNQLNTWQDISDDLAISQFYKIGLSKSNINTLVVGAQDNGTERLSNNIWDAIRGSDGMECIIDPYDDEIIYSTSQYGGLRVTYNGGDDWDNIKPVNYQGSWVTPYKMHPKDNNIIVIGYNAVYKTTDAGWTWDSISPPYGQLKTIALAPSNTDYIYAATYSGLWKTTDNGNNWTYIKPGLPSGTISDVTIASNNPDRIFVTISSYVANEKVYESIDGGSTWLNISGSNLPNLPVNCIIHQSFTNNDLYIGTDIGVYHKDDSMSEWAPFNNGLPSVVIRELEIQYAAGKIRAATYGRGVWESELHALPSSINSIQELFINIYPNPAHDKIIISTPFQQSGSKFHIYNLTGQLLFSEKISNTNQVVDCSFLNNGCYIYKVEDSFGNSYSEKLIIH